MHFSQPEDKTASMDKCFQMEEVREFLKIYSITPRGFVILFGPNGTGKTYAAEAVYNDFMVGDSDFKVLTTQFEINDIWKTSINEYPNAEELERRLLIPKLLIIDDLGSRPPTEAFLDFLYKIIYRRHQDRGNQGTFITTNLNEEKLAKMFGGAMLSRIRSGKVFMVGGEDKRLNENLFDEK